ncbi:MAG TPA: response regulator transcription factor [Acidiphilium sp.]|nr:MAG: two-component system response regulator [Acidiphilium sp. 21-60-14]OYV91460.1 MAG: two-component system response regulator [Acidiphilium sp. 37-60-79]OZB39019.1 MAG: two-component system response regulator [Acidiphilium sp. 34-60-192]HQT87233.1 response regulator transcription factor [Acidiphilium sp.]HQU23569.1 response regulator transcription factor [Acidiphilium sp.]
MKILIFGTSNNNLDRLVPYLKSRLAIVDHAADSEELLDLVRFYDYDAVMLHLSDGRPPDIDLIRRLRGAGLRAPLLVLAAQLSEAGRLRVLEAGADELVVQAASHEEIFLRVQNQARRQRGFQNAVLGFGNVEINTNSKRILVDGAAIPLTKKEYQIIEILALRKGCVLSKEVILDHLYGGLDEPNAKIIDVFICKIRKKMANFGVGDFIETSWGQGYMIAEPHAVPPKQVAPPNSAPSLRIAGLRA